MRARAGALPVLWRLRQWPSPLQFAWCAFLWSEFKANYPSGRTSRKVRKSLRSSQVCREECGQPMQDAITTVAADRGPVLAERWRLLARTLFPFIVVAA